DLRAFGQLAHDLVEHVRRHRCRAARAHLGGDGFGDFQIEVGRLEAELRLLRLDQHVGENGYRVAALDHAMDVAQRLQQVGALDGDLHGRNPARSGTRLLQGASKVALSRALRKCARRWKGAYPMPIPRPAVPPQDARARRVDRGRQSAGHDRPGEPDHSCNWRFSSSISSANALSVLTRFSIFRTACSTVVWSRPPKRRPISGSERSVSVLARYIATCRGRTTLAVRREDKRSERLTLYCRATTRWMSSILIRFGSCGRIRSRTSRSAISSVTGWLLSLEWASRRLMAPSRSRPLWVMVRAR